jgi:hypothetical protein
MAHTHAAAKADPAKRRRRRRLLGAFLLALLLSALGATALALAQGGEWATYKNPRFGTTADYPAHLFTVRDPPPANGDGQGFRTEDGRATLLIYGARNAENDTPQSYLAKYVDLVDVAVSYRRVTARFYVVSGTRGENIIYERCNFEPVPHGIVDCIGLAYPAEEKNAWDPIVARLGASLRPGRGIEPRE